MTGRVLEVLRYVPIPAVRARIPRPHQPYVCEVCFACACVLDLIPSEPQVQAGVSRTGRVTPIPSPVINMTLPGNPEAYSDRLREKLDSPPKTHKKRETIGRIAAGIAHSLAIYTHTSRDAFILGRQKGKACYSAASTGIQTWFLEPRLSDVHPCAYRS